MPLLKYCGKAHSSRGDKPDDHMPYSGQLPTPTAHGGSGASTVVGTTGLFLPLLVGSQEQCILKCVSERDQECQKRGSFNQRKGVLGGSLGKPI